MPQHWDSMTPGYLPDDWECTEHRAGWFIFMRKISCAVARHPSNHYRCLHNYSLDAFREQIKVATDSGAEVIKIVEPGEIPAGSVAKAVNISRTRNLRWQDEHTESVPRAADSDKVIQEPQAFSGTFSVCARCESCGSTRVSVKFEGLDLRAT